MKRVWILAVSTLLVPPVIMAGPADASAQVAWEVPSVMRPGAPAGLSLFLIEPHPGDELGAMAYWRNSDAPIGLGFRGGIAEEAGTGDAAGFFGVDISGGLNSPSSTGEPQVIWWTGAGLGVGTEVVASFPLGISLGWVGSDEGVTFMPNLGGHVVLDVASGPGDDVDIDGVVDLGIDLGFQSGFMVRFGASLGDRDALAFGLRLPR
ncbi:MAG: hypothetical protein R3253_04145 [Longimicrobiales bacterium]|nr:hypothetical protein [Longimicrobiales bacterium]